MTTKDRVLKALNSLGKDDFISGEDLALDCSVSRTAIWKAIRSLEGDGYKIKAVTNRGYRILSRPDRLSGEKIKAFFSEKGLDGIKTFVFPEIDSTNSEAKRRAVEAGAFRDAQGNFTQKGKESHLSLFVAESQTGGKGRMGRVFVSPKDCGVYFSLLYSPQSGIKNPALYTAAAAVAVSRAVKDLYSEQCSIKWVNDLFLAGKKISGILVEGIANFETGLIDAIVVGIGINMQKNPELSGEITKIAGSIEEAKNLKGEEFEIGKKNLLVASVIKNLVDFYDSFDNRNDELKSEMIDEYRSLSMLTGKTVTVNPTAGLTGKTYKAKVLDIDEDIQIVVETESGEIKRLSSGEVSLHSFEFV
ncbi:MAG: biotin--[Treponema sp.]|nr:biotin--[acetyl-CoA-carboxylase] ligase [Treponema sp.]